MERYFYFDTLVYYVACLWNFLNPAFLFVSEG